MSGFRRQVSGVGVDEKRRRKIPRLVLWRRGIKVSEQVLSLDHFDYFIRGTNDVSAILEIVNIFRINILLYQHSI